MELAMRTTAVDAMPSVVKYFYIPLVSTTFYYHLLTHQKQDETADMNHLHKSETIAENARHISPIYIDT